MVPGGRSHGLFRLWSRCSLVGALRSCPWPIGDADPMAGLARGFYGYARWRGYGPGRLLLELWHLRRRDPSLRSVWHPLGELLPAHQSAHDVLLRRGRPQDTVRNLHDVETQCCSACFAALGRHCHCIQSRGCRCACRGVRMTTDPSVWLKNGKVKAKIALCGAELKSLRSADHEFIWQGDPAWWSYSAPLLFPVIGRLPDHVSNEPSHSRFRYLRNDARMASTRRWSKRG